MTRVEEWTSADTGVGAAMAAGSHAEKGIWALFVIAASIKATLVKGVRGERVIFKIIQWPWFNVQAILTRIIASPIRFLSTVIIPALNDFGLW